MATQIVEILHWGPCSAITFFSLKNFHFPSNNNQRQHQQQQYWITRHGEWMRVDAQGQPNQENTREKYWLCTSSIEGLIADIDLAHIPPPFPTQLTNNLTTSRHIHQTIRFITRERAYPCVFRAYRLQREVLLTMLLFPLCSPVDPTLTDTGFPVRDLSRCFRYCSQQRF